ncbi:hypothetical protein VB638_03530 [Dolichospermum sp. UHCC 0684]|jgi:hypothetical protein|uniref:hypothetical protein n=1 Tax=unclassified Dolichospermum TaxID=2622029 RepID=UPI001446F1A9|nr:MULTISPECIES: hypothetical protein [unclassified Dolichospermum]MEA5528666.1 hypothetical protein [Dolichospermum sp. UHCC 0684]MTJ36959.1 hypothetical protein [Dolichospermum sp. UHCC 0260]
MTDVYLPLPYKPIAQSDEPTAISKIGTTFAKTLKIGDHIQLNKTIIQYKISSVIVIGFDKGRCLVQFLTRPKNDSFSDNDLARQAEINFFELHPKHNYRLISQEEYDLLYPDEARLLSKFRG